jgi:hypothetical protein
LPDYFAIIRSKNFPAKNYPAGSSLAKNTPAKNLPPPRINFSSEKSSGEELSGEECSANLFFHSKQVFQLENSMNVKISLFFNFGLVNLNTYIFIGILGI